MPLTDTDRTFLREVDARELAAIKAFTTGEGTLEIAAKALSDVLDLRKIIDRLAGEMPVRCKDCTHCKPLPDNKRKCFADGVKCCELLRGDENNGVSTVWVDDYCNEGERRKEPDDGTD